MRIPLRFIKYLWPVMLLPAAGLSVANAGEMPPPNIVFILADDMGYGDLASYNAQSRIRTPHLDGMARAGMRFADAHAGGAWCVPSRYSLLTGQAPFRVPQRPDLGPVISDGRMTIAALLRQRGYATGMIGKWHLGFEGGDKFDYSRPLRGGPVDRGFDSFFGIHASTDIPPYFYVENDRVVSAPTRELPARNTPGWSPIQGEFWRAGLIAPGLRLEDVQSEFTRRSVAWLERHQREKGGQPFFLYVAFAAPHTPWLPTGKFKGSSPIGLYGDFTQQVDDSVGLILTALDRLGLAENTVVFFASDNGPVWYPADRERLGHDSSGGLRGMKGDSWEGGHRVPFMVRWPGRITGGSVNRAPVCFTDFFATAAELAGAALPGKVAEDSFSLVPGLLGRPAPARPAMVTMSYRDVLLLSVRQGDWKLINGLGSGGFTAPVSEAPQPGGPAGQLYNLARDPQEQVNLWRQEPAKVAELLGVLDKYQREGRSRPE